jgi:2'-5' RNA ligase
MRLFVAVWPPGDVLGAVAALSRPPVVGARWTTRDQWHVTLRFLGETPDSSLDDVVDALAGVEGGPVDVRLGPAVELLNPRIVSVPVHGLEEVGPAVISATAGFGQPPEDRPFRGHLTLARLKGVRRRDLGDVVGAPIDESWRVESIDIVRSRLSPKGARYDTVVSVPL